jgi:cytidylate kinase
MKDDGLQLCRSYVSALGTSLESKAASARLLAGITISREAGARGRTIGKKLVESLNRERPRNAVPWTLFDKDLMKRVLADHRVPEDLAKFFPETRWSEYNAIVGSLLKLHPDNWTVSKYTVDTIRRLGRAGHSIIVGRGSHIITANLPNVLKVRFVGSLFSRTRYLRDSRCMSADEARRYTEVHDQDRAAYVRQHFGHDIGDAHDYSLVVNTDRFADEDVVSLLMDRVARMES